jgi:hypothetical protein
VLLEKEKLAQYVYEGYRIFRKEVRVLQIKPNTTQGICPHLSDRPSSEPSLDIFAVWTSTITAEVK